MGVTTARAIKNEDGTRLIDIFFFDKDGRMYKEGYKKDNKGNLISENDGFRYAKAEFYGNGKKKCFLKIYQAGRYGELVCDPNSLLGNPLDLNSNNDLYGGKLCDYQMISEQTLSEYIEYLRTKNPSRLRLVERKILDGEG